MSLMDEQKIAIAKGMQLNVSPKHSNEVCYVIQGKNANKAVAYLDKVQEKKEFVPFRRYVTGINHRKKGQAGKYPVKAAKLVQKILKHAIKNAEFKGLEAEKLQIYHATAYKTVTLNRTKPKGKAKPHRIDLTNIEIGVKQV